MKKILIVYSGAKHQGGIEKYLKNLFLLYNTKKMELVLVSLGEWPLTEEVENLKGRVIKMTGARIAPQNILKIANIATKEKASLIVSQGVVANAYARSAAFLAKVPHLTTVHSDLDLDYSSPLVRSIYSASDKVSRWRTDKYIAVSEHLKKQLVEKGIDKNKINVVYNGLPAVKVKEQKKDGEIVLGSIGRLHKVKGYDILINAFHKINSNGMKLIIWGEGDERKNLVQLTRDLGLEDKVSFPGFTENVSAALSKIDIYVQPSVSEGFGLTVVEAMLTGKPIIVTPAGSLKELIEDGESGIVTKNFSPKELSKAIEKLLDDTELLKKISANAKKDAARRFSLERWIRETEEVFLEFGNE